MRTYQWPLSSEQEIELMEADVVTFDLFDTLVCRKLPLTEIFRIYGPIGAYLRRYFEFGWRVLQKFKILKDFKLASLNFIFGEKIQQEFEADMNQLVERREIFNLFNALVSSKKRIEIVTNTYYSQEQIRLICRKFNIPDDLKLILSSEFGITKYQGLFQIATGKLGYSHWHFGDDAKEDSAVSNDVFVHTQKPLERILRFNSKKVYNKSLSKSAREIQRVSNEIVAKYEHESDPWFWFGVFYSGPLALGIAQEILKVAKEENASTIYFLARDGYLPFRILKKVQDLGIHYVPYSREISSSTNNLEKLKLWIEIDSNNGKILFFDLGWRGLSAKKLVDKINSPVRLVLFGRWPWRKKTEDINLFFGSIFSLTKALRIRRCPELFELALSAPHQSIMELPPVLDGWLQNFEFATAGNKYQICRGAEIFGDTWISTGDQELSVLEATKPLSNLITHPSVEFLNLASNVFHQYKGVNVPLVVKYRVEITFWTKGSWRYQKMWKRPLRVRLENLLAEYRRRLGSP